MLKDRLFFETGIEQDELDAALEHYMDDPEVNKSYSKVKRFAQQVI